MQKVKALLIKANPTEVSKVEVSNLDDYRKAVNGHIEHVMLNEGLSMYINEEGKLLDLPVNPTATLATMINSRIEDVICGDVLITCHLSPQGVRDGADYDVPAWAVDAFEYLAKFADKAVLQR